MATWGDNPEVYNMKGKLLTAFYYYYYYYYYYYLLAVRKNTFYKLM